jgi:hypothetical protein
MDRFVVGFGCGLVVVVDLLRVEGVGDRIIMVVGSECFSNVFMCPRVVIETFLLPDPEWGPLLRAAEAAIVVVRSCCCACCFRTGTVWLSTVIRRRQP